MSCEPSPNSFRASVVHGVKRELVVRDKKRKTDTCADGLDAVAVTRGEARRGNHRDGDRHRLNGESATALYKRKSHAVDVINVSGGGAMFRCDFVPRLWDRVELRFGEGPGVEGAVRWIRGDRIGIEFAHETRIDCDPEQRDRLLLEVIRRSFPDVEVWLERPQNDDPAPEATSGAGLRADIRHPLAGAPHDPDRGWGVVFHL